MSGQEVNTNKKRKDVGLRLTPRDLILLRWGGEQYALRFDQSQRIMAKYSPEQDLQTPGVLSDSATRHRLRELEIAGLITRKKRLTDAPESFWLTTAGYRAAGLPFRLITPSADDLEHIYWCAQVRLWLLLNQPEHAEAWRSERWQRRELDQKIKQVKLPDAIMAMPQGGTIAVEVERTVKGPIALVEALKARAMIYDQVWYVCPPESIKAVQSAQAKLETLYQQKIVVYESRQFL